MKEKKIQLEEAGQIGSEHDLPKRGRLSRGGHINRPRARQIEERQVRSLVLGFCMPHSVLPEALSVMALTHLTDSPFQLTPQAFGPFTSYG